MKPLIILCGVFGIAVLTGKLLTEQWPIVFSGNLAMCLMLCFTAIGHFKFAEGMVMMLPAGIPRGRELVYLTGVVEPILGIGLLIPVLRGASGYLLVIFFLLILPSNIYAAMRRVNLEKADHNGPGPGYLWFRIPLQAFFIAWVWYFSIG